MCQDLRKWWRRTSVMILSCGERELIRLTRFWWEESGMGARQGAVGVGWGNIWLGQRGWREWEDWPVTGLMRLWHHWNQQILRDKSKESPWHWVLTRRMLLGSFRGFPLHSTPPWVTLWEWRICSFVSKFPLTTLPISAHFLKCKFLKSPWISKSTVWDSLTHKQKRKATSERKNSSFCFCFFARATSGQASRGGVHTVRACNIGVSRLLLRKKVVRLCSRVF